MKRCEVILCCHNSHEGRLERTLRGLAGQTLPAAMWDLLVVDNASDQDPGPLVHRYLPAARMVRESRLGLTPARCRGIQEAESELLVFVDDDNVLAPDYLEKAVEIAEMFPCLGAWGGNIEPEFEVEPDPEIGPYTGLLTLREVKEDRWALSYASSEWIPWGAGMCVRKVIAEKWRAKVMHDALQIDKDGSVPPTAGALSLNEGEDLRSLLGRRGKSLTSAEDVDLAATALDHGYGTGVFARLRLTHLIPRGRLEKDYLLRLAYWMSYSNTLFLILRTVHHPLLKRSWLDELRELKKWLSQSGFARKMTWAVRSGRRKALAQIREQQLLKGESKK